MLQARGFLSQGTRQFMQQPEQNNTMRHSANPGIGEPPLFQIVGQRAETTIPPNREPSELFSVCSENL